MRKDSLTSEILHTRLRYDPETGLLYWKPVPPDTPSARGWNTRYAGQRAFHEIDGGYYQGGLLGFRLRAHRVVWCMAYGAWPISIDHIDRNRLNNRLENLREANLFENAANKGPQAGCASPFKGVFRTKNKRSPWSARIYYRNTAKHLGNFPTQDEAARAYDTAASALHGQFAVLNFPGRKGARE